MTGMEPGDLIVISAEIEALLDRCRRLIYQADNPIMRAKTGEDRRRELVRDLVLRLDETLLTSLTRTFPDAAVFSESTEHRSVLLDSGLCCVVGPIDNTVELLAGRSCYAISIAVLAEGVPQLGVVDFPARDQRFVSLPGQGVLVNNRMLPPPIFRTLQGGGSFRVAVSPTQVVSGLFGEFAALLPGVLLIPVSAITSKLGLLCLGDVDAALHLPAGDEVMGLWDFLGLALALPAMGMAFCDLAHDADLVSLRPTSWREGWVAGSSETRAELRAALQMTGTEGLSNER
jgi:fructose-1,6-bisphosphatase/inositol monophosphatase family enzyme